jgi:capsid protein
MFASGLVLDKNTKRVVGYRFLDGIPGDSPADTTSLESHFVPAEKVFHLVDPDRVKARRGVSHLAAALVPLDEITKYTNAMRVRASIATYLVATHKPAPEEDGAVDALTGEAPVTVGGQTVLELYPGGVNTLSSAKESLEFNKPADFPVGYSEFVKAGLREAGAAVGCPYERFSGDWGATNDRLARVVLNDWRRRIDRFVWTCLVPRLLDPLWRAWISRAALVGDTKDAGITAEWMLHAFPYVHPVQDVQASKAALDAGLISPQEVIAVRGGQLRLVYQQIAQAAELARTLGLNFNGGSK